MGVEMGKPRLFTPDRMHTSGYHGAGMRRLDHYARTVCRREISSLHAAAGYYVGKKANGKREIAKIPLLPQSTEEIKSQSYAPYGNGDPDLLGCLLRV
jgi:hypothetical protein